MNSAINAAFKAGQRLGYFAATKAVDSEIANIVDQAISAATNDKLSKFNAADIKDSIDSVVQRTDKFVHTLDDAYATDEQSATDTYNSWSADVGSLASELAGAVNKFYEGVGKATQQMLKQYDNLAKFAEDEENDDDESPF